MVQVVKLKNLTPLLRKLEKLERESRRKNNGNIIVGFNASYAVAVHEMIEVHAGEPRTGYHTPGKKRGGQKKRGKYWDPQGRGQPKFLEQPAREMQKEMGQVIVNAVKGGATLLQAIKIAGLLLQRAAQKLVPVDTGNLKGSAFTEQE